MRQVSGAVATPLSPLSRGDGVSRIARQRGHSGQRRQQGPLTAPQQTPDAAAPYSTPPPFARFGDKMGFLARIGDAQRFGVRSKARSSALSEPRALGQPGDFGRPSAPMKAELPSSFRTPRRCAQRLGAMGHRRSHRPGEGLLQQRLLQRRQRGELLFVEAGGALGGGSPAGAPWDSPGQRPWVGIVP